jgi:hypothetical protein
MARQGKARQARQWRGKAGRGPAWQGRQGEATERRNEVTSSRHRADDHSTSVAGAVDVSKRAPKQQIRLLHSFYLAGFVGLTDEQAARMADLEESCYWKRCGELRADRLIEFTGETRKGRAGVERNISRITIPGRVWIDALRQRGDLP